MTDADEGLLNFRIASADDVWTLWRKLSHRIARNLKKDGHTERLIGEAIQKVYDEWVEKMSAGAPAEVIGDPEPFFTKAARNRLIDLTRLKREANQKIGKLSNEISPSTIKSPLTPTPSRAVMLQEQLAELARAKEALSEDERRLLKFQDQGLVHAEIATRVSLTPRQVKDKLDGIRMKLRREMGKKYSGAWRHDHREEPFTTRAGAEEAIDRMFDECREALRLVHLQGLSLPDAAREMGVSPEECQRRVEKGTTLLLERHDMTLEEFTAALHRTGGARRVP